MRCWVLGLSLLGCASKAESPQPVSPPPTASAVVATAAPVASSTPSPPAPAAPPKLGIDALAVTEVVLTAANETPIVLRQGSHGWQVGEHDANRNNVRSLLENMAKLSVKEVIDDPITDERLKLYQLDDAQAFHVVVKAGERIVADFKIGKLGSRGQVGLVDGQLVIIRNLSSYLFKRELRLWRDNDVVAFDEAKVTRITIENAKGKVSFTRAGTGWKPSVRGLSTRKVDDLVRAFKKLRATDFAAPGADTGIDDPVKNGGIVTFEVDGAKHVLRFGRTTDEGRYVKLEGRDIVYVVTSWSGDWATYDAKRFR